MRRMTRRSFAWGAGAALAGALGWTWLQTREKDDGIPWPFRRMLEFNERLSRAYFKDTRLAPTFALAEATEPRENGGIGLGAGFNVEQWKLRLVGPDGDKSLTLDDIRALPRVEMVTELKCIEGWSVVVHWAGARLADLAARHGFATRSGQPLDLSNRANDVLDYVRMATPDEKYYVGLDMASALHPQTLLCYEMNGKPLSMEHGAPLRLAIPVKYGIKNIKRIGVIEFTDQRPPDYWAEQGYDWYAGH